MSWGQDVAPPPDCLPAAHRAQHDPQHRHSMKKCPGGHPVLTGTILSVLAGGHPAWKCISWETQEPFWNLPPSAFSDLKATKSQEKSNNHF